MKPIYFAVHKLTKQYTKKQNTTLLELRLQWGMIIGSIISKKTYPKKITRNYNADKHTDQKTYLLHLDVEPNWALEIQHEQINICNKINQFFGKEIFSGLRIYQSTLKKDPQKLPEGLSIETVTKDDDLYIKETLSDIQDEELTTRLNKLGRTLYAQKK